MEICTSSARASAGMVSETPSACTVPPETPTVWVTAGAGPSPDAVDTSTPPSSGKGDPEFEEEHPHSDTSATSAPIGLRMIDLPIRQDPELPIVFDRGPRVQGVAIHALGFSRSHDCPRPCTAERASSA